MTATLTQLRRYPVKSLRGEDLDRATVEPWGLAGDRRWLVVRSDGEFVTAREQPRMLLITPTLTPDGGLDLVSPDAEAHHVPAPNPDRQLPVRIWKSSLTAATVDGATDAWFSAVLGEPVRLVQLDDPTRRVANPVYAGENAPVSFADGYPMLITSTRSLDALNDEILAGPRSEEGPLPMTRFRSNLIVDGPAPWAEDGWRRISIGDAVFRAVKGCARCVMTTTDPDTAARGKEPIASLARIRRFDRETWFGMNLVPETPGVQVSVGDELTVLDAVPAPDGPPR